MDDRWGSPDSSRHRPPLTSGPITPSITIYRLHDMRYPSLSHGYTSFISSKFPFLDESIHTHTSESKNIMTSNLPNSSKISQKNFLYKFDTGTYSSPMHELIIDLDLIEMNPPCFCVYSVQLSPPVKHFNDPLISWMCSLLLYLIQTATKL